MQAGEVLGLDPHVVPGAAGRPAGRLIVDVQSAGADLHEHVPGATEVVVEDHLAAELLAATRRR